MEQPALRKEKQEGDSAAEDKGREEGAPGLVCLRERIADKSPPPRETAFDGPSQRIVGDGVGRCVLDGSIPKLNPRVYRRVRD